jgi:hypothetical protein
MKRHILAAAVISLFAGGIAVAAEPQDSKDLSTQSAKMDSLATSKGNVKVESKISSDFSTFAGSTANSSGLVSGLRNGSGITLSSTDAKGVTTSTTFTPPTGKMGYGNVFISLGLAQQQLTGLGITQPTAQDIQAALVGGTVTGPNGQTTTLSGVLTLRSQGMGWGQIAQNLGYKLGPVISGIKAANAQVSAPPTAASSASPHATGVTNASGGSTASGVTTASGSNPGQGNAYGRGITTGAGGAAGQGVGNAYGRGITSGAGGSPGQSGNAFAKGKGG